MRFAILREIVREAAYGLYHHRFRAALSMLGISWGIISVVVLLAYGEGFRGALDAGFKGAFSDGTVIVVSGTDEPAGGRRTRRQARSRHGGRRAGHRRDCRWSRASAPSSCATSPIVYGNKQSSHLIRAVAASLRRDAEREAAGRRPLHRRRGRPAAPPGRLHRQRSRSASCSAAFRRSAKPSASAASRSKLSACGEEKVQLSNYNRPDKDCVFIPWTTMGGLTDNKYVGTFIWQAVTPALEPQADETGARVPRERATATTRTTSARSTCSGRRRPRKSPDR